MFLRSRVSGRIDSIPKPYLQSNVCITNNGGCTPITCVWRPNKDEYLEKKKKKKRKEKFMFSIPDTSFFGRE